MRYSQDNEEEIILDFFGQSHKAAFLDIGAYDGIFISNTYRLWKNGWYGVYIEPSPKVFLSLQNNISHNRDLFNCAIVNGGHKLIKFYDNLENAKFVTHDVEHTVRGVSTTSKDHVESWQTGGLRHRLNADRVEFSEFYVGCCMIDNIINNLDINIITKIEFLDLDIEGTNISVAETIPFDRLPNLKLLCVEKEGSLTYSIKEYNNIFNPHNYKLFKETSTNLFYSKL
jgi:FkbM family methyltransferase